MRVALLLVAAGLLALPAPAGSQISPGPLAKAHHDLDGPTRCAKCHGLRREPMTRLCLDCHKDIAWGVERNRGLHAREQKKPCASCHPDHAGVGFALIAWSEGAASKFDHARAGWPLEGKHAGAKCESCHAIKFRVSPAAALSKRNGSAGWLGLETTCASCHRDDDVHRKALGAKCEGCHDARGWKPAPKFDHAASNYPLTGKHGDVACDKCHLAARLRVRPNAEGKRIPLFRPVPFKECSSCHDDPHKGRLSPRCGDCHATRGFAIIDKKEFDHGLTRYALAGKHRTVSCDACHGANLSRKNPPYATCGSCHTDAHRGEATLAGKPADCAACHRVEGFASSTFTLAQHESTRYALAGKHRQVKCSACHTAVPSANVPAGTRAKIVRLRPAFARCATCHEDSHGGQLAARADQGACEVCHGVGGWKPSTFSSSAHAKLRLPLDGRHAAIACAACHASARAGLPPPAPTVTLGKAKVLLRVPEVACASCHVDPHAGRYSAGGAVPIADGCRGCHDTHAFRPSTVSVATHARFSLTLEGAHRATPCIACHAEMKSSGPPASTLLLSAKGVTALPFTARRATTCQSCHENPHGTQFVARKDRGACDGCHGANTFAPASRFDHRRDASFALEGAHAKVACAGCHKAESTAARGLHVVYRPLSGKCESCHTGGTPREKA
jgi:hypothetical protein